MLYLTICSLLSILPMPAENPTLTIEFENIRFSEGQLLIGIYQDEASWQKRKPARELTTSKAELQNGKMILHLTVLPAGSYGLAVLDDSNGNEIVDMGFVFPKEGFGFSNYFHNTLSLPQFKNFVFDLKESYTVKVKFRYL